MNRAHLAACLLGSTTWAACTLDFDAAGPHGGESASTASVGGSSDGGGAVGGTNAGGAGIGGAPAPCVDRQGTCVDIPAGFEGPVVVSMAGTCEGPSAFTAGSSFEQAPATCTCGCMPSSSQCALTSAKAFANAVCLSNANDAVFTPIADACATVPQPAGGALSVRATGPVAPPACDTDGERATVPQPEFVDPVDGCVIAADGCEASQGCVPNNTAGVCFHRANDGATCPAGLVQRIVYEATDVMDDRDCFCGCGTQTAFCSTTTWKLFATSDCSGMALEGADVAGCFSAADEVILGAIPTADATVTCTAPNFVPTGAITPVGGLLLCCMP